MLNQRKEYYPYLTEKRKIVIGDNCIYFLLVEDGVH